MNLRRRTATCAALPGLLLLLIACGGGGGGGAALPAFFVTTTNPLDGQFGIELDDDVSVRFNKAIDVGTFGTSTLLVRAFDGTEVSGTTTLDAAGGNTSIRWRPIGFLDPGRLYRWTIAAALRSVDGEALEGGSEFTFVTRTEAGNGLPTADQMRSALGQLNVGRQGHEATLLDDQRVLITGGFTLLGSTTASAEVFLEGLERFVELSDTLRLARASHTATKLADGRVLLAGGWISSGPGQNATTATAELFDPATNTFTRTGTMTTQRADHAAALLPDGRVLLTGGSRLEGSFLRDLESAEVYDPATGMFTQLVESMTHTRTTHGMVDNGLGQIVLGGGSDADRRHDWYVTATGLFEDLGQGASDQGRFGPAMARFDSGVVAIAGGDLLGTVMVVTTAGRVQNTGSGLNRPRSYATAVRIKPDQILVAGGIDFSRGAFIEASCDVLVEGGLGGANTFATPVRFGTGMAYHTATVLPSGNVLFCGGLNEDGSQPNKTAAFIFEVR
ncbi:MAG: kelch repeat-containing protein [Planctomycetota bacterium]|nr:kelch repeat-containing protein [Planctomycetota bacterium]